MNTRLYFRFQHVPLLPEQDYPSVEVPASCDRAVIVDAIFQNYSEALKAVDKSRSALTYYNEEENKYEKFEWKHGCGSEERTNIVLKYKKPDPEGGICGGIPSRKLIQVGATTMAQNDEKLHQWLLGTTTASSNTAIQNAFDDYHSMAERLKNTPEMEKIRDDILTTCTAYKFKGTLEWMKFYGVGAPSGTGKTQIPFTLATYSDCFDVLHVCFAKLSENSQLVYQHPRIADISAVLRNCLINDHAAITSSAMALANEQLSTVTLLSAIFKVSVKRESGAEEAPQTPTQLRKALHSSGGIARTIWPVVVVDEAFQCAEDEYENELAAFLRSILRASGVASIFMGTTIHMLSFLDESGSIRTGRSDPTEWAKLITQLPPFSSQPAFDLAVIQSTEVRGFVKCLLDHYPRVNPRNMHHLYREASKNAKPETTLDEVLAAVGRRIYTEKTVLRSIRGVRAQVHFLLNAVAPADDKRVLVGNHFARYTQDLDLVRTATIISAVNDAPEGAGKRKWKPVPDFPPFTEDPLLHLLLGGVSCECSPFPCPFAVSASAQEVRLTSAAALLLSSDNSESVTARDQTNMINAKAQARNGNVLECIVSLACINASRARGVQGVGVLDFLLFFAMELLPTHREEMLTWRPNLDVGVLFHSLQDERVPFTTCVCGPDGDEGAAPQRLEGLDMDFWTFERPPNMAQADGYISGVGQAEEKNLEQPGGIAIVRSVYKNYAQPPAGRTKRPFGVAVFSKIADLRGDVTEEMFDPEVGVWKLVVKGAHLVVESLLPLNRGQKLSEEDIGKLKRHLFFFECDEKVLRNTFAEQNSDVALAYGMKEGEEPPTKKARGPQDREI
eukprot:gene8786-10393_t